MAEPNSKVDYQDFDQDTTQFLKKLKRVLADINIRMAAVEALKSGTQDFERRYGTVALERIDAAIAPVLVAVQTELANAQAQLASIMAGTAPNAERLGGELPAFYLDPANFDVSEDIAVLLAAGNAAGARAALGIAGEINAAIAALVAGAPGALDTVNELAAAMGNDPNFATTVLAAIGAKADAAATAAALDGKISKTGVQTISAGIHSARHDYGALTGGSVTLSWANGNAGSIAVGAGAGTINLPGAVAGTAATMIVYLNGLASASGTLAIAGASLITGDTLPGANQTALLSIMCVGSIRTVHVTRIV